MEQINFRHKCMVIFQKRFISKNRILYRHFIYNLFIYLFFRLPLCLFVLHLFICFESTNSVWSISLVNGCWSKGNKVLVKILEYKKGAITGVYKNGIIWSFQNCILCLKLFWWLNEGTGSGWGLRYVGKKEIYTKFWWEDLKGKRSLDVPRYRKASSMNHIQVVDREIWDNLFQLPQNMFQRTVCVLY